jgi:VCBS repeat-containing protein
VGNDSGLISGGWNLQITLQPLVTVVDTLPAGVAFDSFVGLNWSCTPNGQLVTCTYNTNLPAQMQAQVLSLIADMPLTSGLYVNQATVSSPPPDPNPNNNSSQWGVTVNAAPIAVDDAFNLGMNTTLVIGAPGVLANDSDPEGQPITASMVNQPAHGTATVNPDGSFSYTPDLGYTGVDSFGYQVSDGFWIDNAQVTLNIIGGKLFLPLVVR